MGPWRLRTSDRPLKKYVGWKKGENRTARGISVVVDPEVREVAENGGFAYCLYAKEKEAAAKAVMLEARNSGCTLSHGEEGAAREEKIKGSACLIVFLDRAFLEDECLMQILTDAWNEGKDLAVCQLEEIRDEDLPPKLEGLHKMQWLNYAHGMTPDMNTKLARHLEKRGCRDTAILPGFEYKITEEGIVILRYTGMDPNPRIESSYAGKPVAEISVSAFANCIHLQSLVIPEGVGLIENLAFKGCRNLSAVTIPDSVTSMGMSAFENCSGLRAVTIPDGVTEIPAYAFRGCGHLTSVVLPEGVTIIETCAFENCSGLTSVTLPDSLTNIELGAFRGCTRLAEVTIPDSVEVIEEDAFSSPGLTIICTRGSCAWKYCSERSISLRAR